MERYVCFQTKNNFEECLHKIFDVRTRNINKIMNDFCEELGENYLFDENTKKVYDKFGNEYSFETCIYIDLQTEKSTKKELRKILHERDERVDLLKMKDLEYLKTYILNYYSNNYSVILPKYMDTYLVC